MALSEEIRTKRSTSCFRASSARLGGAEAVVLDGLAGLMLHHGHVLVGGGVEDDPGLVLREDLLHALGSVMSPTKGTMLTSMAEFDEFLFDLEDEGFGAVQQQAVGGVARGDLAAKFAADAAAGAGDQDGLVLERMADFLGIQFDVVAARANPGLRHCAVG